MQLTLENEKFQEYNRKFDQNATLLMFNVLFLQGEGNILDLVCTSVRFYAN